MGNGVYWESMTTWERGLLEWALDIGKGNYEMTARILGVTKGHVYNRCQTLNIDVSKFVPPKKGPILAVVADATVTAKSAPEDVQEPEPEEPGEDDLDEDADADDDADDETEDDVVEDDEVEDTDPELCTCGNPLETEDERNKWVECTTCHQKRVAKRLIEKTVVKKENGA
jgi:hypothetical protein